MVSDDVEDGIPWAAAGINSTDTLFLFELLTGPGVPPPLSLSSAVLPFAEFKWIIGN